MIHPLTNCTILMSVACFPAAEELAADTQPPHSLADAILLGCTAVAAPWRTALAVQLSQLPLNDAGVLLQLDSTARLELQQPKDKSSPRAAVGRFSCSSVTDAAAALHASVAAAVVVAQDMGNSALPPAACYKKPADPLMPLHHLAKGLEQEGMLDFAFFAASSSPAHEAGHVCCTRTQAAGSSRMFSGSSTSFDGISQPRPGQQLLGRCGVETWGHLHSALIGSEVRCGPCCMPGWSLLLAWIV